MVNTNTLVQAFNRYSTLIRPHRPAAADAGALQSLVVSVADPSEDPPQHGTNESYSLVIPGDGAAARLEAATVYGALRGLETFSQLVLFNFTSGTYSVAGVPLTVVDEPRFQHRGFMVDTSRHYQTLTMLNRLLDSMSYAKLNVLHWHVVDDQSFPLEVRSFPRLQGMGAYSARERYTRLDVADVVEYARLRGIRVMLEIDTPSHTACWCRGYPDVCPPKPCMVPAFAPWILPSILDFCQPPVAKPCMVRVFDRDLHSRMPLSFTPLLRLKRFHVCDQCHSARVCTTSYRYHRYHRKTLSKL